MTTLTAEPTRDTDDQPGEWLAMHVYYAANPQPLLTRCIRDVFAELTERDLLDGYFFINYWLEGPHVRMRLKPRRAADTELVKELAERRVREYLARRPALYDVDTGFLGDLYQQLFSMEFSEDEKQAYLAEDGTMNLRPNNDLAYLPYEPENGKYGGPAGVELAEWHFQHSSDLTIELLRTNNLHLRSVLLGTSAQLMMVMAASFLDDRDELATFLRRYHDFWQSHFAGTDFIADEEYATGFADNVERMGGLFDRVRSAVQRDALDELPPHLAGWAAHCRELRGRVAELARAGRLTFGSWDRTRTTVVTEPGEALVILLSPYLHMTNNRLHVTIRDEAYLAYLLGRVLTDGTPT
ncbi:lantibiotic dehydratase C-terminal domain-containing protein [Nocardioides sp. 1609]|uniref:lantibiotic dehydratase C-terminal domain-containing protein n=1 Tax=Nocardioides sp. 1609 TaxID=2508327 RepID=UPI00106FDC1E|nr:lantibiotic dehydratase C-terminal domain-containing protein [Nocardioides sp. 1609]